MKTKVDVNLLKNFISAQDFSEIEPTMVQAWKSLTQKSGAGAEFTGWVQWPTTLVSDGHILREIEETRLRIATLKPDVVVVIGIGGSYLGARAVYDALHLPFDESSHLPLVFAGHQIDAEYHAQLLKYLRDKSPVVVAISKSGTTTEPAIAFRLIRALMEEKYGDKAAERIVAVTDETKGALRTLATQKGYKTFIIPDDIGGRYSVFTPVGLLPLALCGFDVKALIEGAADAEKQLTSHSSYDSNPAMRYAATRQLMYNGGKPVELLATFYPRLATLSEWWKQLFGESEGKNHKGIFPASLVYSTDLHSMGQYVQDGLRVFYETFITIESLHEEVSIPTLNSNDDGLLYLEGKAMSYVNQKAEEATRLAHWEGGVPVLGLSLPELSEYTLGELMYFFEFACGLSAYAMGVNPFDQPGVEAYKKKMFELLGKK